MFTVTLSQFGNVIDLEAEKRRREGPKDEVFLKITEEKVEFVEAPAEKPSNKPQE